MEKVSSKLLGSRDFQLLKNKNKKQIKNGHSLTKQ